MTLGRNGPGRLLDSLARPRVVAGWVTAVLLAACGDLPSTPPEAVPPEETDGPALTFGTPAADQALGAVVHSSGIYVVGRTSGPLDGPHLGEADAFVRKYHPEGEVLWADQFGTNLSDWAEGAAADAAGNVYVVGWTVGSLAGSRGGVDAFLRKYSKNGTLRWTRQFGTSSNDYAYGVAVDFAGDVYIVGETFGALQGSGNGGWDVFIRKYTSSGDVLWTRQFGTANTDGAMAVAMHPNGTVYVAGYTDGDLQGTSKGDFDAFLRKYSATGDVLWTRQFGTPALDLVSDVNTDVNGAAYLAGYTEGSLTGGNAGDTDAFIRKYSSGGVKQWTDQFGTMVNDLGVAVSIDESGRAYLAGHTEGSLDGPGAGSLDVFVRKYRASGEVAWTEQFGTGSSDRADGVATLTGSEIYVVGSTQGTLVGANQGGFDAFMRRLSGGGATVWTDQ
jgi:hypothetical protein